MKKLIRITTVPLSLDKLLGEQLRFMNRHFEVTAVSSDKKELKRVAEKYGVKHHHVEMSRKITPWQDLVSLYNMIRFLKKEQPEIVHTHTPKAGIIGMMAAKMAGVPVRLHTVAGLPLMEATGFKRTMLNWVEKWTYRFATKVYPNSFGLKEIILNEKFCPEEKLHVIANGSSNGINTDFFNPESISMEEKSALRKKWNISEHDFVFIFVGRLVKDKGINELVSAFSKLTSTPNQSTTPKLLLVGPLENDLDPLSSETLDEISENPNIISVGYQDDVRAYFAISSCLVFPSYREGFPNVVLQAGAMGLPGIVTNINGCNEIIEDGKNGIIIPPKNETGLQKAMEKIFTDQLLYQSLTSNARHNIVAHYRQEKVWDEILKIYLSIQ